MGDAYSDTGEIWYVRTRHGSNNTGNIHGLNNTKSPRQNIQHMDERSSRVSIWWMKGDQIYMYNKWMSVQNTSRPKARAPAPAPPSQPKNLSELSSFSDLPSDPCSKSKMSNSSSLFHERPTLRVRDHTVMKRMRFSLRLKKNQCDDHSRTPRRFIRNNGYINDGYGRLFDNDVSTAALGVAAGTGVLLLKRPGLISSTS